MTFLIPLQGLSKTWYVASGIIIQRPKPSASADLGLILDGLGGCLDLLRIAQVAAELEGLHSQGAGDGLEVGIQLVHQGRAGGNLKARNDVVRDALDHLDDGADGVAVGSHKHSLARFQLWSNCGLPVRHHTSNRVLQALSVWHLLGIQCSVLGLVARVVLALLFQGWRGDVEAASPDLNLLRAVLDDRLLLVQACEATVHALVQAPGLVHGDVELIRRLQCQVAGLDGTLQEGREGDVDLQVLGLQKLTRALGLAQALLGEVHVHPSGEDVRHVPLRLPVAREDQGRVLRHPSAKAAKVVRLWALL